MRRPGYREAIEWLAGNDDCYWIGDRDGHGLIMSVAASMVRDLYDVSDERLVSDLRKALKKAHPDHRALQGE